MWKVLRRYQGEQYKRDEVLLPDQKNNYHPETSAATDPVAYNMRSIVMHETKHYTKPQDPLNLTTPYGTDVYRKLVEHMTHELVTMRRRALEMLLELYVQKGEHVVQSLEGAETAQTLVYKCLVDSDDEVRTQTCIALEAVAQQPKGQELLLTKDYLVHIVAALDDSCNDVVMEALRVLSAMHSVQNNFAGTVALVKLDCIDKYVKKCRDPEDGVACMGFAAVSKTFDVKESFIQVLETGGMDAVTQAISSRTDPLVIVEACELAGKLAYYSAGKRAAVKHSTVKYVLPLINHSDVSVRAAASGALVSLTIIEEGKLQAIDSNVVEALQQGIISENERDVLQNQVKTMSNIAEHPVARLQLHSCIPRLEDLAQVAENHESLKVSIAKAIAAIRWTPGDPFV